jgi:hypothetical protein
MRGRAAWLFTLAALAAPLLACTGDDTTAVARDAAPPRDATTSDAGDAAPPPPVDPATACLASGGSVADASCCFQVGDFPDTCKVGACSCSPQYSAPTQVCQCPQGECFGAKVPGCVVYDGGLFPP